MDGTILWWDAATGALRASFIAPMQLRSLAVHPLEPVALCGGLGGAVALMDMMGIVYGAIVVTATRRGDGYFLRCPGCQREITISPEQLGTALDCPTPTCAAHK